MISHSLTNIGARLKLSVLFFFENVDCFCTYVDSGALTLTDAYRWTNTGMRENAAYRISRYIPIPRISGMYRTNFKPEYQSIIYRYTSIYTDARLPTSSSSTSHR